MAGTVKGIIVEIGGDTSGLQNALKKVNSATSSLSKELRGINSLLKLDPTNTELVSQKQQVLAENIEQTSQKLEELKKIQDEANASGDKVSSENYRALQREIISTENKLKDLQVQASKWTIAGKSIEEFGNKVTNISKKLDTLGNTITTTLTLPVLAIGTAAVTTGNTFEAQMSRVQAIAGATGDELEQLTQQAMDLGAETSFSATEVAEGMENLASAGFTTNEIMEAMPGLLDLAASSGAELATSSEIAASAIRGFGLEASEAGHVADVFAEAAARTNAQTEDMGEAMKYVAPVAKTVGLTMEETAAAIGIMSDAGIKGSQAGTTLRSGLTRIVKPTKQVAEAMETLGVEFYDNNGQMKSLTEIIKTLQDSTAGLTDEVKNQALAQIFGTEALSGMLALVGRGSDDLKDMKKSFEECDGSAEEMADTMLDNTSGALESLSGSFETAGIAIQKALAPEIKKLAKWIQGLVDDFSNLSEEEQLNIIKTVALVAAIGPAIKILSKLSSGVGTVIKGVGTFSQAVALVGKTTTDSFNKASTTTQNLAKVFTGLTSPVGIAVTAITVAIAGITIAMKNAEKDTKEAFGNMGDSANDFVTGIDTAQSHLDEFNTELFASSEEQKKLEDEMKSVQDGITKICKTASDERRNYTQEEITQLDKYFQKLRELNQREIEIQQQVATAITQQAQTNAENFNGSLEEYKVQAQEWIKTAEDQKNKTIEIIQSGTTEQIALLNQRYSTEESRRTEEYQKEYNAIMEQQQKKIDAANSEVAKVNEVYSIGYLQRANQNEGFYLKLQEYNQKVETENQRHNESINSIENDRFGTTHTNRVRTEAENNIHEKNMKNIWKNMYKAMDESQEKQLGTWIAMVAQTEMYGGNIDDETKNIVNSIIESYDSMPKETREAMKNAMSPMLDEMEKSEPSLFAKAKSIADGILSRLRKAFDEHSPSKETRKIFSYLMQGAELGLEDEETKLYRQIDNMSNSILNRFNAIKCSKLNLGNFSGNVFDKTRNIFTTPQITFNVQQLNQEQLEACFNYINRKFGSQY